MKRGFDIALAGLGLLVLSPLLAIIAIGLKLLSPGPALFVQERATLQGATFRMLKFRTMVMDAEKQGALITIGADQRITPLGRLLRETKLDELPQLWNVLRGEMSLVGPRPEVMTYVAGYTSEQRRVLTLKPGITDPASFAFYDEAALLARVAEPETYYREHLAPEKIRINLDYAAKATLMTDLVLVIATVAKGVGFHFDVFAWLKIRAPDLGALSEGRRLT